MATSNSLQGKVAIVTGGTRGIGEAIVKLLAARGASIVINYVSSEERAKALVDEIKQNGGQVVAVQANVGEVDGPKKIVEAAVKAFGKIDILVNNAAVAGMHPVEQVTNEEYERLFNVNVRGPLLLVKESAAHLQEYGRIINISSVAARSGTPHASVYSGTKGALESFSRVWAHEFGGKNITSNSINPGPVSTDMALGLDPAVLATFDTVLQRAALKRWATVEDVATVAGFLASSDSQWVTGDVLNANGGLIFT